MAFGSVDESDLRKVGEEKKSELKPQLRFVEESDIKKVGKEKKSWSDIVKESNVVDGTEYEKRGDDKVDERAENTVLKFIGKGNVVDCERQRVGVINNCALCKELSKDRFDRCPNQYGGF